MQAWFKPKCKSSTDLGKRPWYWLKYKFMILKCTLGLPDSYVLTYPTSYNIFLDRRVLDSVVAQNNSILFGPTQTTDIKAIPMRSQGEQSLSREGKWKVSDHQKNLLTFPGFPSDDGWCKLTWGDDCTEPGQSTANW